MSKRLILTLFAATLATTACANPVGSDATREARPHLSHDQAATPGGNMMGGGS
jgi:hypothetical protein